MQAPQELVAKGLLQGLSMLETEQEPLQEMLQSLAVKGLLQSPMMLETVQATE